MRRKTILFGVGILIASLAMAAPAQAGENIKTYKVRYERSELLSASGRALVLTRIENAAYRACKGELGGTRFTKKLAMNRCINEQSRVLASKIGDQNITDIYAQVRPVIRMRRSKLQRLTSK